MKIPASILALTLVALALFWWFGPEPDPALRQPRTDLPWQVEALPNGSSRVFDLELGSATLADAVAKFGPYEDMAVFQPADGPPVLEVYFGTVSFGPLSAKVVTALAATPAELQALIAQASAREGSPTGDWKYRLAPGDQQVQRNRLLRVITYIPAARDLDADFFRARLGEPAAWKVGEEQVVQWFYPERGLSVVINASGREVLEYTAPRDFRLPEGVEHGAGTP